MSMLTSSSSSEKLTCHGAAYSFKCPGKLSSLQEQLIKKPKELWGEKQRAFTDTYLTKYQNSTKIRIFEGYKIDFQSDATKLTSDAWKKLAVDPVLATLESIGAKDFTPCESYD